MNRLLRLFKSPPVDTHLSNCTKCGEPIALSWSADDPPVPFSMHRCEVRS